MSDEFEFEIKEKLATIEQQVVQMCLTVEDIRPQRGEIGWFAERQSTHHRSLTRKGVQDALNHASALIGYYDGIEARGAFQRRTADMSDSWRVRTVKELLDFVHWVLSEILTVIRDLSERAPLQMCKNGPKKPGPHRTTDVCIQHLASLHRTILILVLNAAKSEDLRNRIKGHLTTA